MKKALTRNIPLKILSFLLAILVWLVIMNMEDPFITQTIDEIVVDQVNANIFDERNEIYDVESGEVISIKVRGKRSVIEHLKNTDFIATADFREMSTVYAVPIRVKAKPSSRYSENDIEILDQNDVMTLSLEEADTQTYRVEVIPTGEAREGFYVTDMVANPNIIEISGSKKQVAKIHEVIVEVSIEQSQESFQIVTKPKALDINGYPVDDAKLEFQTKEVAVVATVLPTKEIGILVTKEGAPYYGYTFTKMAHEPKVITIAGTQEDLDKIGYINIPFDISMSKETVQDTRNVGEYLDSSRYKLVGDSNSIAITATIEKLLTKELVFFANSIKVLNLDPDYDAVIRTPGTITTLVLGPEQELGNVTMEVLEPYIDLTGYAPGTYSVTIATKEIPNLTVRPMAISVEITEKDEE